MKPHNMPEPSASVNVNTSVTAGVNPSASASANARQPSSDVAWQALHANACAPYKTSGRFAWHWARGKLGRDPVFRGMLERGDMLPKARVVDIGCGQGLVASLLSAAAALQARGQWPGAWPQAASYSSYTGIELMQAAVGRGQNALQGLQPAPQLLCADMCTAALPACDEVVILDVLHYVNHEQQLGVLQRVHAALAQSPGPGRLLLRVGDTDNTRGFAISQWVDKVVTFCGGHRTPPTWGRRLTQWQALLRELGFQSVQAVPMSQGTPFANVLLVADLRPGATL
jgi:SAM-dependent methyltransferase